MAKFNESLFLEVSQYKKQRWLLLENDKTNAKFNDGSGIDAAHIQTHFAVVSHGVGDTECAYIIDIAVPRKGLSKIRTGGVLSSSTRAQKMMNL